MDPWPLWVCDLSKRGSYEVPLSPGVLSAAGLLLLHRSLRGAPAVEGSYGAAPEGTRVTGTQPDAESRRMYLGTAGGGLAGRHRAALCAAARGCQRPTVAAVHPKAAGGPLVPFGAAPDFVAGCDKASVH